MGLVTITLGFASAGAFLASVASHPRRRDCDDVRLAGALVGVWFLGASMAMLAGTLAPIAGSPQLYIAASIDALTGFYAVSLHRRRPAPWKRVFVTLVGLQLCLHAAFGFSDKSMAIRYGYIVGLNLSFVLELLCVAWPGVRDGFRALRRRASAVSPVHRERGAR